MLTFGGDPVPLDDGLYLLNARMVFAPSPDVDEDHLILRLFVNDMHLSIVTLSSVYLICCQEAQEIPPGNRLKPTVNSPERLCEVHPLLSLHPTTIKRSTSMCLNMVLYLSRPCCFVVIFQHLTLDR